MLLYVQRSGFRLVLSTKHSAQAESSLSPKELKTRFRAPGAHILLKKAVAVWTRELQWVTGSLLSAIKVESGKVHPDAVPTPESKRSGLLFVQKIQGHVKGRKNDIKLYTIFIIYCIPRIRCIIRFYCIMFTQYTVTLV